MFSLGSSHRFYLYDAHYDMQKSFDGLCGLVISVMQRQPTSGEVFVFLNRSRTHIKLLHWERGGFVLYYKRLEQGTFGRSTLKRGELSWSDLVLMIQGLYKIERKAKEERLSPDQINELRLEESLPVINEMGKWIFERTLPKSQIGKAMGYAYAR